MTIVKGRRAAGIAAALLWAVAIGIALAGPVFRRPAGTETILLCTLDIGAAIALTICAWLEKIITPLIAGHLLGLGAGFRSGTRKGKNGRHHKENDGRVIQLAGRRRGS